MATAHAGKFRRYREAVEEWGSMGIRLQPLVWFSEGRAHPDVERVMAYIAAEVARRTAASAPVVLRRWKNDVSVVLATRRARMARKCLPSWNARHSYVLHGIIGEDEGGLEAAGGVAGAYVSGKDPEEWEFRSQPLPPNSAGAL